jgi:hypothetical protein
MGYSKLFRIQVILVSASWLAFSTACSNKQTGKEGWTELFDGKTLTGWKILDEGQDITDTKPEFYVEDSMIVCNTTLNTGGGYLVTEKSYDDFILEFDVRIDTSLNSGMQCRGRIWDKDTATVYLAGDEKGTTRLVNWKKGYIWGYQVEVDPSERAWSGGLYEPGNRGWLVRLTGKEEARRAFKPSGWNHYKILMDGDKIQIWVNDVQTVDTTDNMTASGFFGIQFHGAGNEWQKDKKSMWKNIRIKEL